MVHYFKILSIDKYGSKLLALNQKCPHSLTSRILDLCLVTLSWNAVESFRRWADWWKWAIGVGF